ncbi:MAG: hypothetical protein KAS75_07225 [Planctomycetes bacterium]|nr:hypothetical protein [Planctomycetota bacterium]
MTRQNILRLFLFILFFSIGAAAFSAAILCGDLYRYYHSKQLLEASRRSLDKLESLNADYDALLNQLRKDPNFIERIAAATLGTEPKGTDTVYPKTTAEQLAAARKALTENSKQETIKSMIPKWVERCNKPYRRAILFLAGACLILISFMWFGSVAQKK